MYNLFYTQGGYHLYIGSSENKQRLKDYTEGIKLKGEFEIISAADLSHAIQTGLITKPSIQII